LESLVLEKLRAFFADAAALVDTMNDSSSNGLMRTQLIERGHQIANELGANVPNEVRTMLMTLQCQVIIKPQSVEIGISRRALAAFLSGQAVSPASHEQKPDHKSRDVVVLKVPAELMRAGREIRMLVDNSNDSAAADPSLLRIIARAHDIQSRLNQDTKLTVHDAAREERVSAAYIYNLLRLPWLAPDITTAIINGRHPRRLNAKSLMRQASRLPADWTEQRVQLGFTNTVH
jgi:hypothetical protein